MSRGEQGGSDDPSDGGSSGNTAAELYRRLNERLGKPGKWEMLFRDDGELILSQAEQLDLPLAFDNPVRDHDGGPPKGCVPYGATIPAVHDFDVLDTFRQAGAWDQVPRFYLAGERHKYRLDPCKLRVGILIAGGPAAGLNMVTDSLVKRHFSLATQIVGRDGTHELEVFGYIGGYVGLGKGEWVRLAPAKTALPQAKLYPPPDEKNPCLFSDEWSTDAGVKLTSGREGKAKDEAETRKRAADHAAAIQRDKLDVLYLIGGNGTLAWAREISRALGPDSHVVIIGGPKTMDNDVYFTDVTFGFRTAVDNALQFVRTIHTAAESVNRVGVIELFGAGSGFIAMHAGYVSGVADYVMIPELNPVNEEVLDYVERRFRRNKHAVLVVAEGALAEFRQGNPQEREEAFSNFVRQVRKRFPIVDVRARYLMRDTPPNSFDLDLCKYSGKLMVDTALAGFRNCSVHLWQGDYVLVPFETGALRTRYVLTWSYYLQMLLDRQRLS